MNGAARTETAKPGKLLLLVAGFLLWSSAFVVLYGLQGLGCRLGWDEAALLGPVSLNRAVLLAACAVPTPNVEVSGGSASPTRWRVGIPF